MRDEDFVLSSVSNILGYLEQKVQLSSPSFSAYKWGDLGDFSIKVSLSRKFMTQEDIGLYFNNCINFMKKILTISF